MSSASTVVRLAKVVEIVLAEHGLTVNQFRALELVEQKTSRSRELSVRLAMKPPNVTALLDGLVARDLVVRDRRADDRRHQVLRLTGAGRSLLRTATQSCDAALRSLADQDPQRRRSLLDGIDRWKPALDLVATQLASEA